MRSLPAILVGVGLFLTGIALGALYHNEHVLHARELELRTGGKASVDADDLLDADYMARFALALVAGSAGVALTGAGVVLIAGRLVDRRHPSP